MTPAHLIMLVFIAQCQGSLPWLFKQSLSSHTGGYDPAVSQLSWSSVWFLSAVRPERLTTWLCGEELLERDQRHWTFSVWPQGIGDRLWNHQRLSNQWGASSFVAPPSSLLYLSSPLSKYLLSTDSLSFPAEKMLPVSSSGMHFCGPAFALVLFWENKSCSCFAWNGCEHGNVTWVC